MPVEIIVDVCGAEKVSVMFSKLEGRGHKGSIIGTPLEVAKEISNLKTVLAESLDLSNIIIRDDNSILYLRKWEDYYVVKTKVGKGVKPLAIQIEKDEVGKFLQLLDDIIVLVNKM